MRRVDFSTGAAPHIPSVATVGQVMRTVLYALVPGIALHAWFFGPGILIQIALASVFALSFEALMLRLRGRSLKPFINDYSAVVTAVLFALCIPPLAPWWISAVAMLMAIVIAKHLYGGLGQNVFNPAMIGYVVALISFPQFMTRWQAPAGITPVSLDFNQTLLAILHGRLPAGQSWDSITQATPLDTLKTGLHAGQSLLDVGQAPIFGGLGGAGWEWVAAAYLAGGMFLLLRRVITWHVPLAALGIVLVCTLPAWLLDPVTHASPAQHLFSGALMLGAFFIATDPVSGCASNLGRLWFGLGVGLITLVIRRWGGYPDGVAFAVLLMNMAAPLIDRYTRPRVYGT
jgi:electron transport complex protein RnfD